WWGAQVRRSRLRRWPLEAARVVGPGERFPAMDSNAAADLFGLARRWLAEERTVVAALHDLDLVRANFPSVLLLAREPVAWGAAAEVLTADNLVKARRMCEAFDEAAAECAA